MKSDQFSKIAHLYLGLSRQEFARRVKSGLIDCEILKAQIEQNSQELSREVRCEQFMFNHSVDQVDKFSDQVDKFSNEAEP